MVIKKLECEEWFFWILKYLHNSILFTKYTNTPKIVFKNIISKVLKYIYSNALKDCL